MKKLFFGIVLSGVLAATASALVHYPAQKYGVQTTVYFQIYDSNSPWRAYLTPPAANDVYVLKDGGSAARATNAVALDNRGMKLVLTASEMTAAWVRVDVNDASSPPLFGEERIVINTYGNASASQAFDLGSATVMPGTGSITNSVFAQNSLTANAWDSSITWELLLTDLTPAVGKKTWGWWLQKGGGGNALEITGTAAGGSPNTIILQAGSSPDNNKYIPCTVTLVSGKGSPTNRVGLTYTGSTRTLTIGGTWPGDSPDGTTVYKIDIPTTSSLSAQGIAQGGTANTIVLAAGAVTTDDMTGFIQLVSGTGSGAAIYSVRDSYDANDTLVIEGTWAGDSPDTTTYYSFAPSGNIVRDTYNYSYLTQLYETTNNAYTYITDVNNTLNEFYTYQTDVNETHITNLETAISNTYTYLTDVNETYISNLITEVSNTYTYVADMNGVTNLLLHDAYGLEAIRAQISLISGEYDTNDLYGICEKILNAIRY